MDLLRPVAKYIPNMSAVYSVHDVSERTVSWDHRAELYDHVDDGECEFRLGIGADDQTSMMRKNSTCLCEAGHQPVPLQPRSGLTLQAFPTLLPPTASFHFIEGLWIFAPILSKSQCTVSWQAKTPTIKLSSPSSASPRPISTPTSLEYLPSNGQGTYPMSHGKRRPKIDYSGEEVIPVATLQLLHPGEIVIGLG